MFSDRPARRAHLINISPHPHSSCCGVNEPSSLRTRTSNSICSSQPPGSSALLRESEYVGARCNIEIKSNRKAWKLTRRPGYTLCPIRRRGRHHTSGAYESNQMAASTSIREEHHPPQKCNLVASMSPAGEKYPRRGRQLPDVSSVIKAM